MFAAKPVVLAYVLPVDGKGANCNVDAWRVVTTLSTKCSPFTHHRRFREHGLQRIRQSSLIVSHTCPFVRSLALLCV